MNAGSIARMQLAQLALESREEATMLLLASKAAVYNAEDLELAFCKATDEECIEILKQAKESP